ncbi:hypothetical protein NDU88_002770 [Pleurodeles waltl]|uniref:Uncharacterized protein n=1 Tax=Pleurodeles waltl TaxID=8319 RepID=A0AAV7M6Z8_PLEWA|nr:hypothetical protein NDU88_002770 [Pleurodeles waltl]
MSTWALSRLREVHRKSRWPSNRQERARAIKNLSLPCYCAMIIYQPMLAVKFDKTFFKAGPGHFIQVPRTKVDPASTLRMCQLANLSMLPEHKRLGG